MLRAQFTNLASIDLHWTIDKADPYPPNSVVPGYEHKHSKGKIADVTAAFVAYDATWAAFAALPSLRRLRVVFLGEPRLYEPITIYVYHTMGNRRPAPGRVTLSQGLTRACFEPMERMRSKHLEVFDVGLPQHLIGMNMMVCMPHWISWLDEGSYMTIDRGDVPREEGVECVAFCPPHCRLEESDPES